ncbi:hypothetical protein F5Y00DRAFT_245961 [Daldinia vernicosa]|uniref:uncharacterized protein n=1 Tax=Daldinia vernicosa TaxID=114800 RepID=UPI0020080C2B|nr:uncharacterized protein F5Y00DRAFT_245961 [Daldinia vernicosa]KAI0845602.1 hypothetical protein F5Y00DRAFT_245961 [Daldinia vernicosa]
MYIHIYIYISCVVTVRYVYVYTVCLSPRHGEFSMLLLSGMIRGDLTILSGVWGRKRAKSWKENQ